MSDYDRTRELFSSIGVEYYYDDNRDYVCLYVVDDSSDASHKCEFLFDQNGKFLKLSGLLKEKVIS